MATRLDRSRTVSNGSAAPSHASTLRVGPPPGRHARLPELVLGVALMVGFSLAAVLWHMGTTTKEAALALARPVARGHVIDAGDLRVVYLSSDDPIAHLARSEAASIVGRASVSDLPAGTVLTSGSVAPAVTLGPDDGVVGLALDPGQVPAVALVPGDLVNVIAGPAGGAGGGPAPPSASTPVVATDASVFEVGDVGTQGRRFVSIKLPVTDANLVAAAAERGPIRLVLVAQ